MVRMASLPGRDGGVDSALRYVRQSLEALPDVEEVVHDGVGAAWEFRTARGELGHVHADGMLHVRLAKAERDLIVAAGVAQPLPHDAERRWIAYQIRQEGDAYLAAALLHRSWRSAKRTDVATRR